MTDFLLDRIVTGVATSVVVAAITTGTVVAMVRMAQLINEPKV